jgi:hypothetical protein
MMNARFAERQRLASVLRATCARTGLARSPGANAPFLQDQAFPLLVAQIELLRRDDLGRLSIWSLDNS